MVTPATVSQSEDSEGSISDSGELHDLDQSLDLSITSDCIEETRKCLDNISPDTPAMLT